MPSINKTDQVVDKLVGGRNSWLVVCWARCPAWCSVVSPILDLRKTGVDRVVVSVVEKPDCKT